MQKTITLGPHPQQLLANAVLHLANALDNPCGIAGVGPSCEAARDLVRDLAAPEHAGKPFPAPRAHVPLWTLEWKGDRFRVTDGIVTASTDVIPPDATVNARIEAINALVRAMRLKMAELERITALSVDRNGTATPIYDDERVMVRAVAPAYPGPDVDRDTWALDPDATGHRAPFSPGDLVVRSSGRAGIHEVLEVSVDGDAPRERSLRIRVKPTDVVVDQDAF